jgi:hypothetical protein
MPLVAPAPPFDDVAGNGEVDALAFGIDVRNVREAHGRVAVPEEIAPPDQDLVWMVGVLLVPHVLEHTDFTAVERDDPKIL